ncbi:MAG TPA: MerR family transcriptional regulator [Halanaerobiaceae bacterium]|jgi:DNA-binding transcriptional MerR regulator|nr:MerR family transcriptional regulator [Bacillota bacterium]HHU92998.1 MerR family transcriptional regulator [Halanaerobiaceae bacterium]HOA40988.1 MerR family transcriptional regulator [Halanaerobiales bacterium]HPZ63151.1 MerR family transcriptional regulator [Halanaerobiales bacterium]HQD04387.1 MerR family transcriptional regulator [Halanaerobiales bacterium]
MEMYSTSEAAKILNVAPSTLRYWESEFGNILNIQRNENGYRQYSKDNIEQLKEIKTYLYEQKYSIKQVREILNLEKSKQDIAATIIGNTDPNLSKFLHALLEKFDNIEDGLKELKDGQKNLKEEYLQAIKLLSITQERRDRELIKEIRYRLNAKKEKNTGLIHKLLPWSKSK